MPQQPEPDCTLTQPDKRNDVWCKNPPPDTGSTAHKRIQRAIDDMRAISDTCATRANILQVILNQRFIHVYPEKALPRGNTYPPLYSGAFSPLGEGEAGYIGLSEVYTKFAYDSRHKTRPSPYVSESPTWLQQVLAHEADHLMGIAGHTTDPQTTTHSQACGGG